MPDDEFEDVAPRRSAAQVNVIRAAVVVGCFVVALVLLLGPAGDLTAGTPSPTTSTTLPPAPVVRHTTRVQMANGTTVTGAAQSYRTTLSSAGWNAPTAVNLRTLPTAATQTKTTIVYFLPGEQPAAKDVAQELHIAGGHVILRTQYVLHQVPGAAHDQVVVILGTDLAH